MNTCAYRYTDKTCICSSTWQRHHRFSLTLFILLGQESPECFLFPKEEKKCISLIQPNNFCFWRPGSIVLVTTCQIILIFSVVRLSAAAGHDKPEQRAGALSPLSDALPFYHHHLRLFPPRAVSRFLLSQKQDSCFDNGYCGFHQMQEAFFKKKPLKILLFFKSRSIAKPGSSPRKIKCSRS